MGEKPYTDENWLRERWENPDLTVRDIAEETGVTDDTISRWASKFGFPEKRDAEYICYKDEDWLWERWSDPDYTVKDIVDEAPCSRPTIDVWREKFDFPPKRIAEGQPYTDEEWLRERWWSSKPAAEIADAAGCNVKTIYRWGEKHGFPPRSEIYKEPWHDPEVLRELYHDEMMSQSEIAEYFGTARGSIQKMMEKHEITRRSLSQATLYRHGIGSGFTHADKSGYESVVNMYKGEAFRAWIHRLVAVAEHGIGAVKDKEIHHKNNIPWDNRPENLEVLTESEHKRLHAEQRRDKKGRFA